MNSRNQQTFIDTHRPQPIDLRADIRPAQTFIHDEGLDNLPSDLVDALNYGEPHLCDVPPLTQAERDLLTFNRGGDARPDPLPLPPGWTDDDLPDGDAEPGPISPTTRARCAKLLRELEAANGQAMAAARASLDGMNDAMRRTVSLPDYGGCGPFSLADSPTVNTAAPDSPALPTGPYWDTERTPRLGHDKHGGTYDLTRYVEGIEHTSHTEPVQPVLLAKAFREQASDPGDAIEADTRAADADWRRMQGFLCWTAVAAFVLVAAWIIASWVTGGGQP